MELRDKTELITGGTAGIVLEGAKQFLAAGSKVIITGRGQLKPDRVRKSYPELMAIIATTKFYKLKT